MHTKEFRNGTKLAKKLADDSTLDEIQETLEDFVLELSVKLGDFREEGKYWRMKNYRQAKRHLFTALANVCRASTNLGMIYDEKNKELNRV